MRRLAQYFNPIARLGKRKYSFIFPLLTLIIVSILSEIFAYYIVGDPMIVGKYIIFVNIALILYFAFRDGMLGGVIATLISILYYLYIIYSRGYKGNELVSALETTFILALLYLAFAFIIGWLKQTIDGFIEREADERKRLQSIIEQLPVGVVITDAQGKIVQVNKKHESLLGMKIPIGYKIGDELLVETKSEGKKITPNQGALAQTLATGKPVVGKEFTFIRRDGVEMFVQTSASVIHNKHGKIIAAASIASDVTQQKELEKRKDDFVNMASHELKTPITSMKLYVETLIKRMEISDDKKSGVILSRIKYQTDKLQELVSDLLDVSRIQTGRLTFSREPFVLNSLLGETVQALQETFTKHTISLIASKQITVTADKFRLYQVITNLLTNAVKYSPEGEKVIVRLKKIDGRAVVSIQDFGIGITKEQQKKIFERLYQVTDPTEKTFPGLGMGLYISKEIIKRHKGRIWVESQKGKGSTFFFSLPLKKR